MGTRTRPAASPQVRGRELARLGTRLWRQLGSVHASAEELMRQHRDVPRLQAFRYACGLSQDQAAARYNETTGHRTTLGGTTVNAWETWARGRGGPCTATGLWTPPTSSVTCRCCADHHLPTPTTPSSPFSNAGDAEPCRRQGER